MGCGVGANMWSVLACVCVRLCMVDGGIFYAIEVCELVLEDRASGV